jgi:acetylornithine deacetylase/succinyl-diaminopimelate desuccinylase-like protein
MSSRQSDLQFVRGQKDRYEEELKALCAIPSISSEPAHRADVARAAGWLADRLRAAGMRAVEVIPTGGHPVVVGESPAATPGRPTVLVYGHYDVQPGGPRERWHSEPFDPEVRDGGLYARGAADMKGPTLAAVAAAEAVCREGPPPVNLRWLLEGEEEIGSPSLPAFLEAHAGRLRADTALNLDAGMLGADRPTITYGLRGIAMVELRVHGPARDVHSGEYGGVLHNPAQALAELIAGMHSPSGRVTLPGFYDSVRPPDAAERAEMARLPLTPDNLLAETGAPALWGEPGFLPAERVGARPTLEVNRLTAGPVGEGMMTIIPGQALAHISMRLVPDQDPEEVYRQMRRYLEEHAPPTVRWEAELRGAAQPALVPRDSPATKALDAALETAWGVRPLYQRCGGGIPVVTHLQTILGVDSVLTGFGLPEDNVHGPDEKIDLATWHRGIEAVVHFFHNLAG